MIHLLRKEIQLSMHPITPIMLLLSAMLLIPNYPYYVVFFYTTLAIFFTCLLGRENRDVIYSMTLPVAKKDIVKARFAFVILVELLQMVLAIPFAVIRQSMSIGPNEAGMDANIALFGLSFILYAIFNFVFFRIYYRDVKKVGKAFLIGSVFEFVYIGIVEVMDHVVPVFVNQLDTKDPEFLFEKCIVLIIGILVYVLLGCVTYRMAVTSFERQDIQ